MLGCEVLYYPIWSLGCCEFIRPAHIHKHQWSALREIYFWRPWIMSWFDDLVSPQSWLPLVYIMLYSGYSLFFITLWDIQSILQMYELLLTANNLYFVWTLTAFRKASKKYCIYSLRCYIKSVEIAFIVQMPGSVPSSSGFSSSFYQIL